MIKLNLKRLVKAAFNLTGFDVVRRKSSPGLTLLGLQSRPIQTVIDVGANTGQFARMISDFLPLYPVTITYRNDKKKTCHQIALKIILNTVLMTRKRLKFISSMIWSRFRTLSISFWKTKASKLKNSIQGKSFLPRKRLAKLAA